MNAKTVVYWIASVYVAFAMFSGGIGELTRSWGTLETVTILGYPEYFLSIIAIWKIAGALAILAPGLPRVKEWAYAGMFFNMTGAFVSHVAVGDFGPGAFHLIATGATGMLVVASWALRPRSRRLGAGSASRFDEPDTETRVAGSGSQHAVPTAV
jgi:uncharacterized membrane protein YphA (DoxX/SURF4 family)